MKKVLLLSFLSFFALLLLGGIWLLTTTSGAQQILQQVKLHLPGKLTTAGIHGNLLSRITLTKLAYDGPEHTIQAEEVSLSWQPWALLQGNLKIQNLRMNSPVFIRKKSVAVLPHPVAKTHKLPQLPLNLYLEKLHIFSTQYDLRGNARISDDKNVGVDANLQCLWHPSKQESATLLLKAQGSVNNYQIQGELNHSSPQWPKSHWKLKGKGNLQSLTIHQVNGTMLDGKVTGQLQAHWNKIITWHTNWQVTHLNPGQYWQDLPGDINFHLSTHGEWHQNQPYFSLQLNDIRGQFRGDAISGNISLDIDKNQLNLHQSQLRINQAALNIKGGLQQEWNLDWQLNIPELYDVSPYASGHLQASGKITGPQLTPYIHASVKSADLSLGEHNHLGSLTGTLALDLHPKGLSQIKLSANDLQWYGHQWQAIDIHVDGHTQSHQLQITAEGEQNHIIAKAHGSWQQNTWKSQWQDLSLQQDHLGKWQLQTPFSLAVSQQTIDMSKACLDNVNSQFCAIFSWQAPELWRTEILISKLNMKDLSHFLPENTQVQGQMNFTLKAKHNGKAVQGRSTLAINQGNIRYQVEKQPHEFEFSAIRVNSAIDAEGLTSELAVQQGKQQPITAAVTLPNYYGIGLPQLSQAISAHSHVQLQDISFLSAFFPQLVFAAGQSNMELTVSGHLGKPTISGHANLKQGKITIPALGVTARQVSIQAQGKPDGSLHYQGDLLATQGELQLHGQTQLKQPGWPSRINLTGKQLTLSNTSQIKIIASPHIQVNTHFKNIDITGSIPVEKANINIPNYQQAVTLPDNVVFTKTKTPVAKHKHLSINSRLSIALGNDFTLQYRGFNGQLAGKLNLVSQQGALATATGNIHVMHGTYGAYGNDLKVRQGELNYTGNPLNNPGVNIEAVKKFNLQTTSSDNIDKDTPNAAPVTVASGTLYVGVKLQGQLKNLNISLFANPAILSEADKLSYLVLGYPVNQASEANAQLLFQAASSLNLGGSNDGIASVTQQIKQGFGLSKLGVDTTSSVDKESHQVTQQASLVMGKYLTPRLYVDYSIGLLDPVNLLKIHYDLTERWALETQTSSSSSNASGIDLSYTLER